MTLVGLATRFLRGRGYEAVPRFSPHRPLGRRRLLLERFGITHVLDVGANEGQYALQLREAGYRGVIVSFEPLASAFATLTARARGDASWKTVNCAVGERNGTVDLHVAGNSYSSSVLQMLPLHEKLAPQSRYTTTETVRITTLDDEFPALNLPLSATLLKIDTQGYERNVLLGASRALETIDTVQLEMSIVPLYAGEPTFDSLHSDMVQRGFRMVACEPEFYDERTGELYQVDCMYHRYR